MTSQGWLQIGLTLLIGFLISIPVGGYLARMATGRKTSLDRLFDPIDNGIYLLIGRRICAQAMDWKAYTLHMLATNFLMALIIFLILVFQDLLPLNPRQFAGMEPMLAFNTAVSFITNTDWQAYGGETTLSNFSQMAAITFPMFTSATTGFVVAMAFIRAFTVKDGGANLGNFYRDLIRFITRVLMPASFVLGLLLIQQGEPQSLASNVVVHTVPGGEPDDRARSGGLVRDHQAYGHQRRRLFQCQRLPSL
jgi:K+-transporting ATPase ATPase A chain